MGKEGREGGKQLTHKTNLMTALFVSQNTACQLPKVFADSSLLCFSI